MTNRAGGRAAFILAIGFLMGLASPSLAADGPADNAAMAAPASPGEPQAAPAGADQLSESDRSARQDDMRSPVVVTQNETPAPQASPVVAGSENATWDETSLIGKIFIGFGALLTIASAARMFMA